MAVRGKNRLRLQKLNVGLYGANDTSGNPHVISDVVISGTEEVTEVDISSLPQGFELGAVYLN